MICRQEVEACVDLIDYSAGKKAGISWAKITNLS